MSDAMQSRHRRPARTDRQLSANTSVSLISGSKPPSSGIPAKLQRFARIQTRNTKTLRSSQNHTLFKNLRLLIPIIVGSYLINPTSSNPFQQFIFISYPVPPSSDTVPSTTPLYGKGTYDLQFITFYTLLFLSLRRFAMRSFRVIAIRQGIKGARKQTRFSEQLYYASYGLIAGSTGLVVMRQTSLGYFNTTAFYISYPHIHLPAPQKTYYLIQASYWLHQCIVMLLGLEARRKDFRELVAHHVITVLLVGASYYFHFTMMGVAVFVSHDVTEFFLAMSIALNILNSPLIAPSFALCICAWIYMRHYLNLRILYSVLTEFRTFGPYGLDWEKEQYKGALSRIICFVLLAGLQCLNLFWLWFLGRSAWNFVVKGVRRDERSEGEGEDGGGVGAGE